MTSVCMYPSNSHIYSYIFNYHTWGFNWQSLVYGNQISTLKKDIPVHIWDYVWVPSNVHSADWNCDIIHDLMQCNGTNHQWKLWLCILPWFTHSPYDVQTRVWKFGSCSCKRLSVGPNSLKYLTYFPSYIENLILPFPVTAHFSFPLQISLMI